MTYLSPAAAVFILASAVPALADPGFYLGASIGAMGLGDQDLGSETVDPKKGADMSFYLGYDFGHLAPWGGVRADLQFSGQAAEVSGEGSPEYLAGSTFANVYADYDPTGTARWVPYLGLGVGKGSFQFDEYSTASGPLQEEKDSAWGGQATIGVSFHATEHVRLFADIRHTMFSKVNLRDAGGNDISFKPRSTSLNAGLAYHF